MAKIIMAVYDTEENGRAKFTDQVLDNLLETVDFKKHKIVISNNASCKESVDIMYQFHRNLFVTDGPIAAQNFSIITNPTNLGTARAVNIGLLSRSTGEYCVKMDNDCVVHQPGWLDEMEATMKLDPTMGILGLKRVDLEQHPNHHNKTFRSELHMLPHTKGDPWRVIEKSDDIMGTCTMFSPQLMDAIGLMYQMNGVYGFDDADYAWRSRLAGFYNAFIPHIRISHIDSGENEEYLKWKQLKAGEKWKPYQQTIQEYKAGTRPLYYDGQQHITKPVTLSLSKGQISNPQISNPQ